jgi:hypothetical protein
MFSKKATKIDEIFTVDLTLCSKCQIKGEDTVSFHGLFRKHELYQSRIEANNFLWIFNSFFVLELFGVVSHCAFGSFSNGRHIDGLNNL